MVYATAFEQEDVYTLAKLSELAQAFDASIKVVHISTEKDYEGTEQMEWFKEFLYKKVSYPNIDFTCFFSDNILKSLQEYVDKENADILVMLEREKRDIIAKWFGVSLVGKMESQSKVPLLSFREGNHQLFFFTVVV